MKVEEREPIVIVPPVRALPTHRMSGRTSAASQAKRWPVRQKPVAISSAMMAASVSGVVSPGTATMSRPTEQTALMLSRRSIDSAPVQCTRVQPGHSLLATAAE